MEYDSGIQSQGIHTGEELEITHEPKTFTSEDSYLDTEVVSSNHSECVRTMRERLIGEGYQMVDRSIVKFGKQIGKGGQGTVYQASVNWPFTDKATTMAVKKFNSKLGILQGLYPRELLSVDHIHVVRPKAFFFDDDSSLCMLMSMYSSDLRDAIDAAMRDSSDESGARGAPFEDFFAFVILQVALGMKGLHDIGIYHRDLKAANILVTKSPHETYSKSVYMCHIADFENSEHVVGTAFWRAPEVLLSLRTGIKLTKDQWQAADVYSFGMTCYEILTGEIPFHGHPFSDYDIVLDGGRPELPDHIPQILKDIIWSCWHPIPESRPDFGEIVEALTSHAQEDPFCKWAEAYKTVHIAGESTLMKPTSGNLQSDLLRLKELVQKHYDVNIEAKEGHLNYPFWGSRFVVVVGRFVSEFGWNSYQTHQSLPLVLYFRRLALTLLITQEIYGFNTNVILSCGIQELVKVMHRYTPLFFMEKLEMMVLARNMYGEIMKGSDQSRFEDNDNDLTMKENLENFKDIVDEFEEDTTLRVFLDVVERMDHDGASTEIVEFLRYMKFKIRHRRFLLRHRTFLNKYDLRIRLVVLGMVLYLMYNSSYCEYILFRIFGIMLRVYSISISICYLTFMKSS